MPIIFLKNRSRMTLKLSSNKIWKNSIKITLKFVKVQYSNKRQKCYLYLLKVCENDSKLKINSLKEQNWEVAKGDCGQLRSNPKIKRNIAYKKR